MRRLLSTLPRLLLFASVCVWLGGTAAQAAESSITADFDGDGQNDRVTVDHGEPSVLHVWLSTTGMTFTIRSTVPVLQLVARDLDGDNRAELIGHDSAAGLHIWTNRHKGFHAFRPHRIVPGALGSTTRHRWDDGPPSDTSGLSWNKPLPVGLVLSDDSRGPSDGPGSSFPSVSPAAGTGRPLTPLRPRPPPLSL
jgi:hypothetical protein